MPSLGPAEILVILVVALLVFGPNKMPEIARQVGKGFREFRRVQQHLKSELRDVVSEFDSPSSTASVEQEPVPMLPPKDDAGPVSMPEAAVPDTASSMPTLPVAEGAAPEAPPPSGEPGAPSETA
jgi:sec-independent protein translocase protein TatA